MIERTPTGEIEARSQSGRVVLTPAMANARREEKFDARLADRRRRIEKLRRELGPIRDALGDPCVSDIYRNPDGRLIVERIGAPPYEITGFPLSDADVLNLIGTIAEAADVVCNAQNPVVETIIPEDGSRFSAVIPPISVSPMFSIRKRAVMRISLDDYVDKGIMTIAQAAFLRKRIAHRDNILVIGPTGSGKTTLANAILQEIAGAARLDERILILEDTPELQCTAPNVAYLETNRAISIEMPDLLRIIMRHKPTRICVGELRGPEAHTLVDAWGTGHPGGVATIHAGSGREGLTRLENLIRQSGFPVDRRAISETIRLLIVVKPTSKGRVVSEMCQVIKGFEQDYTLDPK